MKILALFAATAILVLLDRQSTLAQGSLTPPADPAPGMKTLDQIEPRIDVQNAPELAVTTADANYHFIINQPGSYYLSANLEVTRPNGIQVNTEGVTVDLNGFEISGTGGNGIEIAASAHRASIRNGSIKGFLYGIRSNFGTDYPRSCGFRDIVVKGCTANGIQAGTGAVLEACRAHDNSGTGISAGDGSSLTNCVASSNTNTSGSAIQVGAGAALNNCIASHNTVFYGISAGIGSCLENCTASYNVGASATSAGINGDALTVKGCSAFNNSSSGGSSASSGMGFYLGGASTIQNSNASQNKGDGIYAAGGSCLIQGNLARFNGNNGDGAGIHSSTLVNGNRIENNQVISNDRGIDVDAANNIIVRNSARSNTVNYDIVPNNVYGAIVDRTVVSSVAVTGNSATASTGTTDPWANFSY